MSENKAKTVKLTPKQETTLKGIIDSLNGLDTAYGALTKAAKAIKTEEEYQLFRPHIVKRLETLGRKAGYIRLACHRIKKAAGLAQPSEAAKKRAAERKAKKEAERKAKKEAEKAAAEQAKNKEGNQNPEGDNLMVFTGKEGIDNLSRIIFTFLTVHDDADLMQAVTLAKKKIKR